MKDLWKLNQPHNFFYCIINNIKLKEKLEGRRLENSDRKTSSSLKVGILTVVALMILIFTVLWIKGRTLSAGERIEVVFHDVNGIRPGSGVQMMGLRIGQIEEITPVINGKDSYVKVKFVITEKDVEIPTASTISIQQSGLIGEQFLEVMPPKAKTAYIETSKSKTCIKDGNLVFMKIDNELKAVGKIEKAEVLPLSAAPIEYRARFKTPHALKLDFIIDMPGLTLDPSNIDAKFVNNQIIFFLRNGEDIIIPKTGSPYTVIEPMRISDFLELQYKSAQGLAETNEKITQILSDEFIYQIKDSVENINKLTAKATGTMDKADMLLDSSKDELTTILSQSNVLIRKLSVLSDNINDIASNKELQQNLSTTMASVGKLSNNLNTIIEDKSTKEIITNLNQISKNLSDISTYVNEFTDDENVKKDLKSTLSGLNQAIGEINKSLVKTNSMCETDKLSVSGALSDTVVTARNLKQFSEKLNKRFLLFRLMF